MNTSLCRTCGTPVRLTAYGWGHETPVRITYARSAHRAVPLPADDSGRPRGAVLSPFTRRALAGELPAKRLG